MSAPLQILDIAGKAVRTSKNLACISRHCNAVPTINGRRWWRKRGAPSLILIDPVPVSGAEFQMTWGNGDTLKSIFASAAVCVEWMTSRRFLAGAELSISADLWQRWIGQAERDAIAKRFKVVTVAAGKRIFLTVKESDNG
ncbi:hypothetical protein [Mesorhizobium sp. B2-8-9]|uniref:hypothetical protein n=1 Tax=Mesorhizobium sp. B2-8-9 TaxID=2589899 RepID=UPI00112833E9|nr:hypothetical protein [Mesorhizobium sp. B2-8-9]TPI86405.1 hypothetical protein FJ423_00860 [Mesorhizobium sp. B2-8-9]